MALILRKATPFGESVNSIYWKVGTVNIDWHKRTCLIIVLGFADQDARISGAMPVSMKKYQFPRHPVSNIGFSEFPFVVDENAVAKVYNILKTMDEWAESEDAIV